MFHPENGDNSTPDEPCGYIDKTGNIVIRVTCRELHTFIGGLAAVDSGSWGHEKQGYINTQGKFVWGPKAFKPRRGSE
ncbi:MAG TPA: WG repeat-containing protein [Blastocatellia bacterium]|nr:WG repeat-containing protein [Blastocatellia bacterium]